MTNHAEKPEPKTLPTPSSDALLEGLFVLGKEAHLGMSTKQLVGGFLMIASKLFPQRLFAVRVVDIRVSEPALVLGNGAPLRDGLDSERITLKPSSIEKSGLKNAVGESARLRLSPRWDSPFAGIAAGFSVPLVASGELYGVLDVGYPLGYAASEDDERVILPIANGLSVALRNRQLYRETTLLRDYQAKLIEHANALILGVDRNWRVTVCNRALCELAGFDREELVGTDLRDWLSPDDSSRLLRLISASPSGASVDNVEIALNKKGGGEVRTVWSVAAVSSRDQLQAVIAIGQDQTRVRELQNQVIQAEKLATLGQLAAGVVHELNNPLTSITVYAEYLVKKADQNPDATPAGDREKLQRIADGAHRIMSFARDLVQYAKPAGHERELVDINNVIRQSLSFCEHLFRKSYVTLEERLAADIPPVFAVPGQLEQVLINLVTNAVHACGEDGTVRVSTARHGDDGVTLIVGDSGPGIAVEKRAAVFEPFVTTKEPGKGTGLGLSIVANIVDQHGGEVRVDTSELGGAAFVVELPSKS